MFGLGCRMVSLKTERRFPELVWALPIWKGLHVGVKNVLVYLVNIVMRRVQNAELDKIFKGSWVLRGDRVLGYVD